MPSIPLLFGASKRSGFPEIVTVNVLAEKDPTSQQAPMAAIARMGLEDFDSVGTAPIRAMFQKQGLFDDAALIVANTGVLTLATTGATTTITGVPVAGSDLVDVDGGLDSDLNSVARIATGDALYKVTPSAVTLEDFPEVGGAGATSVAFIGGYWLAVEAGTDVVFFQVPAATTWDQLQFASAEYGPDKLVAVRQRGDQFVLLGSETTEVWALTGDATSPLAPYGGLKFDYGCRARPAAVNCQGALIWVDHQCAVRMFEGGEPRIISDHGLEEQIRNAAAADIRASFFKKDGHPCYVLTLGTDATWIYDLASQVWTRATSQGYDYWRAHLFCNLGDMVFAGDALSNRVWLLDPDRRTDGDDTFTCTFCGYLELKEGSLTLSNVVLDCAVGDAPRTGQGSDPKVVMRICRDRRTFGPPKERSLGATGEYLVTPKWNAQGDVKSPFGAIFEISVSDPVGRRFSGLRYNVTS